MPLSFLEFLNGLALIIVINHHRQLSTQCFLHMLLFHHISRKVHLKVSFVKQVLTCMHDVCAIVNIINSSQRFASRCLSVIFLTIHCNLD